MSSIQERLQLKRVPLDTWNIKEQLCLASAVVRSGDQNWMSVSRALKTVGETNRPPDWYSQKSCAAQYGALLEHVETPKRKKRSSEGAVETPQESILKRLTQERIVEIQKTLAEMNQQYDLLKTEITEVRNPSTSDDRLKDLWASIEAAKRARERENARRTAWLKEREERRARADRTWKPAQPTTPTSPATPGPPSSPLLTSLLKSSPVVTTPQHITHPANVVETVSPSVTAPTLSLLLEKSAPSGSTQHESKHAAIEHIKSQLVQIEQQLNASTAASPVPPAPLPAAPSVDIDDIEIKAEDVYAFRDVDIHIPPVATMHKAAHRVIEKPTFKRDDSAMPAAVIEEPPVTIADTIKEEPMAVESLQESVEQQQQLHQQQHQQQQQQQQQPTQTEMEPEVQPDVVEVPPPPEPEPEVKISFPEVKFPTPEIKVIQPDEHKIKEEVKEPELPVPEPEVEVVEEEPPVEIVPEESTENLELPVEAIPEPPPVVLEETLPEEEEKSPPLPPEAIPLPPEPETEAEEVVEEPVAAEPALPSEPEVPPQEPLTEVKEEPQEPLPLEEPSVEDVIEDIKKDEDAEDSLPLKDMLKDKSAVQEMLKPLLKAEEDSHTETDDDTPMELSREEEKDGKKKRDYSRKKKSNSRTCSGSESAPDSPSGTDADRRHRLWKKSVMLVYSRLCAHKYASLFVRPISDDEAPGYSTVVKRPMDLTAIRRNIDNGTIRSTAAFQRDVLLMLSNALMYNSSEHSVYTMAREMHQEAQCQLGMLLAAQAHAGLTEPTPRRKRRRPDSPTHATTAKRH